MKVNLSKDQHKKSYFPISLDSSTTSNFGECIPLFMHELVPQSHCSVNIGDAVRFSPLSFPTFGKAYLKTFVFNHLISDLYPPFNDLLAQTPYTSGSGNSYIPSAVPSVPLWFLWLSVLSFGDVTFYSTPTWNGVNVTPDDSSSTKGSPFVDLSLSYNKITNISIVSDNNSDGRNLTPEDVAANIPLILLRSLYAGIERSNGSVISAAYGSSVLSLINYINRYNSKAVNTSDYLFFNNKVDNLPCRYTSSLESYTFNDDLIAVTPQNADYIFPVTSGNQAYYGDAHSWLVQNNTSGAYSSASGKLKFAGPSTNKGVPEIQPNIFACIRLNDTGKLLRKILIGLGYKVACLDREVSLLPLYAYFKSWFDTFAPKRYIKFEQTQFSKLINTCVQYNRTPLEVIVNNLSIYSGDVNSIQSVSWSDLLDDLASCYYTKDTDYFSAQIIGMINDYGGDLSQTYIGVNNTTYTPELSGLNSDVQSGAVPAIDFSDGVSLQHTQAQQNILSRLTQFVNRRSAVGGKISSLLKSVFGISSDTVNDDHNSFVGSSVLDVNISDVFSTAETADGYLGEYAGKALSVGKGDTYTIDTNSHSILLAFSVVYPRTQYVQGINPVLSHIRYSDFYNPMFDGLTLLPTRKSDLLAYTPFSALYDNEQSSSFGNLPIFTEYKTKSTGVLNGDLSLRSTKASFDSFTMDELISDYESIVDNSDSNSSSVVQGVYNNIYYDFNSLAAGTMWRYLGRWLWLGRFDRIFVNNRLSYNGFLESMNVGKLLPMSSPRNLIRTDDNLICHHVIDVNINAPMVPLSGSWMTDDMLSLDRDGIKVQTE